MMEISDSAHDQEWHYQISFCNHKDKGSVDIQ